MAWVIECNHRKTPSKFRNVHGRSAVIVKTLPISKRTKVDIYILKVRFFLVGFSIAKFIFPIKEWGNKVELGQF